MVADLAPTNASSRLWSCQRTDPTFTNLVGSSCPNSPLVKTARVGSAARVQVLTWFGGGRGSMVLMWTAWVGATLRSACVNLCRSVLFLFSVSSMFIRSRYWQLRVLVSTVAEEGSVHICSGSFSSFSNTSEDLRWCSLFCICEIFWFWECQDVQAFSAV